MKCNVLIFLLSLLVCCSEPKAPAPLKGKDCLILVLDALHAEHLECYNSKTRKCSPNITAFSKKSVLFKKAWSQSSWTLASTASLFTGQYQETHGLVHKDLKLDNSASTLAKAFSKAGYQCFGFSQMPFASSIHGFDMGFISFKDLFEKEEGYYDGVMADRVLKTLTPEENRAPRFVYAHLRRPHAPYNCPNNIKKKFSDSSYNGPITGTPEDLLNHNKGVFPVEGEDLEHLINLYHAGIWMADKELRRIFEGIDRENTLIVLLSDHGEAFAQHKILGHNYSSYEEMVHIVLMMSHPLFQVDEREEPVMTIDLFPTLVELFDLSASQTLLQGRSLAPALFGKKLKEREMIFTSSRAPYVNKRRQMLAAFDGRYKFIYTPRTKRKLLFDLKNDPMETQNLNKEKRDKSRYFYDKLIAWKKSQKPAENPRIDPISNNTQQRLKELGY